jgi:2,3-bisphosphoglycerate-dependent phosphoglycerate mutase/probable phosphoglycerate mutase
MRTSVWFVRHGQTQLNKARRYQGTNDSPLTDYGIQQANALAERLRPLPFTLALVSPAGRAQHTANAILQGRYVERHTDARWAETSHGRWEGLTYTEVTARFREEAAQRFAEPLNGRATGGESLNEVVQRVAAGWNSLLREHPGGRILIVTHATPIQLILCAISGMPPTLHWRWRVDLGSVTALDVYGGGPIVRMVNETPRLNRGDAERD